MIYIKSFIAGILSVITFAILLVAFELVVISRRFPEGGVALDVSRIYQWPVFWIVALLSFSAAFYLTFRASARKFGKS
ncbi:MAG: hypothetical protein M3Y72_08085 [Acidobacteriota bacterium]|nr:hypothetical protein [Acidobacteriota bacterium]